MKNYIQRGEVIEVPAATSAVASGQVVVVGALLCVANHPAKQGEPFNANLVGVYEVPKAAGAAVAQGAPLYWDASVGVFAAAGAPAAGDVSGSVAAFAAAAAGDSFVLARFSGVPGIVAV